MLDKPVGRHSNDASDCPEVKVAVFSFQEKADIFSWSNLLAMGVKIALSLVSSYASGNIDRNGDTVSPMQVSRPWIFNSLQNRSQSNETCRSLVKLKNYLREANMGSISCFDS